VSIEGPCTKDVQEREIGKNHEDQD